MMFIKARHLINKDKCEVATLMGHLPCENSFSGRVYLYLSTRFPKSINPLNVLCLLLVNQYVFNDFEDFLFFQCSKHCI